MIVVFESPAGELGDFEWIYGDLVFEKSEHASTSSTAQVENCDDNSCVFGMQVKSER